MQTKNIAMATALAAAFAGNAFAFQPASGEAPLFQDENVTASAVSRDTVRQEALASLPASGTNNAVSALNPAPSQVTRAAVREDIRNAMLHGFAVKSGEMS